LYLLQNAIEFEAINQQQLNETHSTDTVTNGIEIMERLNSSTKKFENFYSFFTNLVEIIKNLIKNFHHLIVNTTNDESKTNDSDLIEKKQPTQIFCSLIELMSILFTRVKSYQISNRFLIDFSTCFEMISELNSISKQAAQNNASISESPSNLKRNSRLSTTQTSKIAQTAINFQSNRYSNDLYDKFSMQIASFIQNHLNKSYSNHQFDTCLLEKIEPIFYSFLKNCKLSLKQKTIQAWNTTFGKSTAESLTYTTRLETLFSDLKDEMSKGSTTSSSTSIPWISLPYFRSIQSTNLTNSFISEIDDYLLNEEKENKPKNNFIQPTSAAPNDSNKRMNESKANLMKELINESSSSSVPVAMLFNKATKTPERTQWTESKTVDELKSNKKTPRCCSHYIDYNI